MVEWNRDATKLLSKYTLEFRQRAKKAGFDANDLAGEVAWTLAITVAE